VGIIQRQSIKGTIYSYIGVIIGFITTGLLFPKFLSPEEIGLLSLLVSYSSLFAIFGNLGFNSVIIRLFPYFRDDQGKHHGFFFIALIVLIIGFLLAFGLYRILKPMIIRDSIEQSKLFVDYISLLTPLIFFSLVFNTFDAYNRALFNATFGTFLKDLVQRLLIFAAMILYILNYAGFHHFVFLYAAALCVPGVLIFYPLLVKKEIHLLPETGFVKPHLRKEMFSVSFFGIIVGFSNVIIQRIDTIMINSMIDLSATGIYTISFFFGTLVAMPARSLTRISTAFIADAWKENKLDEIRKVYYKGSLNQGIIGSLLFIGIWANIHNIYQFLPQEFIEGKFVILFFGISALLTMLSGISAVILNLSSLYRFQAYFILAFGVLIVITNLILIPQLGIVGAAIAACFSNFTFHVIRILFIYRRFKIQPFDHKILLVLIFAGMSYLLSLLIPEIRNYIWDILLRSLFISIIFGTLILVSRVSEEVDQQKNKVLKFISKLTR
jgi:O-antigen/teichoic acid export membrane protein